MKRFDGTLVFEDLGPGAWVLETKKGERLSLQGSIPAALAGQAVTVWGETSAAMGFAMSGPTITVDRIGPQNNGNPVTES